ncbi:MAG: hypothetical protein FWF94_07275 [Oscillospiraceae bacterium]|nr:hypothetical protein [Oscillospiraceae bacterium]
MQQEKPVAFVQEIKHKRHISYWRIVSVQIAIAAVIAVIVISCKLFNKELYEYIKVALKLFGYD